MPERLLHDLPQAGFVALGEILPFFDEILRPAVVIQPHKTPPYLDIAYILVRECMMTRRIASALVELEISRKGLQHRADGNRKESFDDEPAVFRSQIRDRLEGQLHRRIVCFTARVFLELQH